MCNTWKTPMFSSKPFQAGEGLSVSGTRLPPFLSHQDHHRVGRLRVQGQRVGLNHGRVYRALKASELRGLGLLMATSACSTGSSPT